MSMLDGVSQCWWLSKTCEVNWDAWGAIGTVAAVFAAVLAPTIQRLFVRKKANAMFALAYRTDLLMTLGNVRDLRRDFPFGQNNNGAWAAEGMLLTDEAFRQELVGRTAVLGLITSREVDLTKWQGVDVALAAKVALAIETTKHLQQAFIGLAEAGRNGNASHFFSLAEHVGALAEEHLFAADDDVVRALKPITQQDPAAP